MSKIKVLKEFMSNPKEVITLGYQAIAKKKNEINFEKRVHEKYKMAQLPTIDLLDLVPGLHDTISSYSFLTGTSMVTDILLLKSLAKKFDGCSYLEIGSFRGESIANVADVAKECISVTLSEQEMRELNMPDGFIKAHGIFSKGKSNIISHLHNSLTFDFGSLNKKFDLIFVDGDHAHDSVVKDTQNVFKLLKNDDSIIVWHDYGFDPETVRHEVMSAILEGTPKEYHGHLYHVSNTMCAIFIRGKFATSFTKFPTYPNKAFRVTVEAKKLQ